MMAKEAKVQSPNRLGNKVFIRSVTHHYTGLIVGVSKDEILLKDAAWIADNGRFSAALASGQFNEVEPYPADAIVAVARGAVLDTSDWKHDLPRTVK